MLKSEEMAFAKFKILKFCVGPPMKQGIVLAGVPIYYDKSTQITVKKVETFSPRSKMPPSHNFLFVPLIVAYCSDLYYNQDNNIVFLLKSIYVCYF